MATLTWTAQTGVNRGDEVASGGRFRIIPRFRSQRNKMDEWMLWDNDRVAWSTTTEHSRASVLRPRAGVIKRGTKKHLKYWAQRSTDRAQAFVGPAARVSLDALVSTCLAMFIAAMIIVAGCSALAEHRAPVMTAEGVAAAGATPALNAAQDAIQAVFVDDVKSLSQGYYSGALKGTPVDKAAFSASLVQLRDARDTMSHVAAILPPAPGPSPPNPPTPAN